MEQTEGVPKKGNLVDDYGTGRRFLGRGTVNPGCHILIRLLTRDAEPINTAFFRKRIGAAMDYRKRLAIPSNAIRMVYGDADALPGLLLDCYGDIGGIQILTAGMERLRGVLLPVIQELLRPQGTFLRNDAPSRLFEGLLLENEYVATPFDPVVSILEDDLCFHVNIATGQKTGFSLDQRENRLALRLLAADRRVLDCFCYTGGFAPHAAKAGALSEATFLKRLENAATDAKAQCRILAIRTQAADHPVLLSVPETKYLKCVFLERL